MYQSASDWIGIVAAGIIGCVATGIAVQIATKIPMKAVAGNPGKQLWSVIFAIPLPFLMSFGSVGLAASYLVLTLAPSIASKYYFGPKKVPFRQLATFNSVYAIAAIAVFIIVKQLF